MLYLNFGVRFKSGIQQYVFKIFHPPPPHPTRVVPAPDGTIYLVDINETHYWGSLVWYMYWGQKDFSEKIETYQYMQKKDVHVLMVFFFRFIGKKKVP